MPYVDEVEQAEANPELSDIYRTIEKNFGFVPHFFKALGPVPEVIKAQLQFNAAIMGEGALSALVKEQIGVVVSGINSSSYCIAIHMELLRQFGIDTPTSKKLVTDYMNAPVDDKTKALFRFADKLTRKPLDVDQPDADEVLRAGWSQAALRETVLTVAFFNYINRVSFGLGLVTDF
ncbi:MAG TPA: peroxidase-related enzyme [Candidatus Acidoferrales bacterium]|nr:peroxidase-related enzyme [Candidatus Acidoferrales bacterium]